MSEIKKGGKVYVDGKEVGQTTEDMLMDTTDQLIDGDDMPDVMEADLELEPMTEEEMQSFIDGLSESAKNKLMRQYLSAKKKQIWKRLQGNG